MKICVLDGHALNPGDMDWSPLSEFGPFTVHDRTPPELLAERIGDSDAILLNKINIGADILARCPFLRYIGVLATGYNVIDIAACRAAGVTVTNIPAYSTFAVAQHVFALLLEFSSRVAEHSADVHSGGWVRCPDFCYWNSPLTELAGKTFGVYGYGSIGSRVAKIAEAFGMRVAVCTRTPREEIRNSVTVRELFAMSDIISLHAPLTPQTDGIVNEALLATARKGLILINTARGGLVVEQDVRVALDSGAIAGYAADVVSQEPMLRDSPLLGAPNCILTPHLAWAPLETRRRLLGIAVQNLRSFVAGAPQNVVA